jgi:hypothetical protein
MLAIPNCVGSSSLVTTQQLKDGDASFGTVAAHSRLLDFHKQGFTSHYCVCHGAGWHARSSCKSGQAGTALRLSYATSEAGCNMTL